VTCLVQRQNKARIGPYKCFHTNRQRAQNQVLEIKQIFEYTTVHMIDTKRTFLIRKAEKLMESSRDPIHDLSHVRRVVENAQKIGAIYDLSSEEEEAVILAAWWHDVARILTKQPSFVWMACIDDMVSALMLCLHSIRYGFWRQSGGIATKLILSKTFGTGAVFTKLLLTKRQQTLMHILRDADHLDIMHVERLERVCEISRTSKKYLWGLRCLFIYSTRQSAVKMHTSIANQYLIESIETILAWMHTHKHDPRYVNFFGKEWIDDAIEKFTLLHRQISPIKQIAQ
jgi:hypothetical protein